MNVKFCAVLCVALAVSLPILFAGSPMTNQVEQYDEYHGVRVADPYRWLETDVRESDEVAQWVKSQNESTAAFLQQIPQRDKINRRLNELWNF
jgi:prolyl oligopeptidase